MRQNRRTRLGKRRTVGAEEAEVAHAVGAEGEVEAGAEVGVSRLKVRLDPDVSV